MKYILYTITFGIFLYMLYISTIFTLEENRINSFLKESKEYNIISMNCYKNRVNQDICDIETINNNYNVIYENNSAYILKIVKNKI